MENIFSNKCGNGVVVNVVKEIIKRLIYDLQC